MKYVIDFLQVSDWQMTKKYIFLLIRADFLRRSHQFAKVVKLYTGQQFPEPNQNAMCAFQLDRAKAKDDRCYQIKDALGK